LIPLIANLALTPYIIRGLGTTRWGLLLSITVLTTMMGQLDGGIGQAALRNFTLHVGAGDKRAATRLLMNLLALISFFGVALTAVVFSSSGAIVGLVKEVPPDLVSEAVFLLRVLTGVIAFAMMRQLFASLLFAHNVFFRNAIAFVFGHVIYLTGVVASIHNGWGLYGVGVTFILQQVFSTLVIIPPALRMMDFGQLSRLSRSELKDFFSYAWRVQVSGICTFMTLGKDTLLASTLLSADHGAYYGQGASFAQQLRMLPSQAMAPMQGILGRAVGGKGVQDSVEDFVAIQRYWVLGVSGWCAVGIPATYFGVQAWLPEDFTISGQVSAVLLVAHLFTLLPIPLKLWALTLGHAELEVRYGVALLLASFGLTFPFISLFGVIGTVYATAVGSLIATVFIEWNSRRVMPVQVPSFWREIPVPAALAAGALTLGMELLVAPSIPGGPIGLVLCGGAALPGVLLYGLVTIGPARIRSLLVRVVSRTRSAS
jgi:O-antigen/teichoic acid export membrane protein